jgi:hypothetical protein
MSKRFMPFPTRFSFGRGLAPTLAAALTSVLAAAQAPTDRRHHAADANLLIEDWDRDGNTVVPRFQLKVMTRPTWMLFVPALLRPVSRAIA